MDAVAHQPCRHVGPSGIFVTMTARSAGLRISSEIVRPARRRTSHRRQGSTLVLVVPSRVFANLIGVADRLLADAPLRERIVLSRLGRPVGLSAATYGLANRFLRPVRVVGCLCRPACSRPHRADAHLFSQPGCRVRRPGQAGSDDRERDPALRLGRRGGQDLLFLFTSLRPNHAHASASRDDDAGSRSGITNGDRLAATSVVAGPVLYPAYAARSSRDGSRRVAQHKPHVADLRQPRLETRCTSHESGASGRTKTAHNPNGRRIGFAQS